MNAGDVESVFDLWSAYVSESFMENFKGEQGDLDELISLDRWGPGVAIPMVEVEGYTEPLGELPKEPSVAVREHLTKMVDHPLSRCLVAEGGGLLVGFLTYEIRFQGTDDSRIGTIAEVYVDPQHRRRGIGSGMVRVALEELRRERIGVFRASVPLSPLYRGARHFFLRQGWDNDMTVFSLYD